MSAGWSEEGCAQPSVAGIAAAGYYPDQSLMRRPVPCSQPQAHVPAECPYCESLTLPCTSCGCGGFALAMLGLRQIFPGILRRRLAAALPSGVNRFDSCCQV